MMNEHDKEYLEDLYRIAEITDDQDAWDKLKEEYRRLDPDGYAFQMALHKQNQEDLERYNREQWERFN